MELEWILQNAGSYGLGVATLLYFLREKSVQLAEARQEIKDLNRQLLEEVKHDND